jgi:membrane-bound lytic murein transglycosylase D
MHSLSSIVEEEVSLRGLPRSLAALPIVESGYVLEIANPSGAGGLWQIMPSTARTLGLEVSSIVDERRDPVASTRAALDYLERHFAEFGSWFLAIAAYNAGSGTVGNLISRAGGRREGESGDELFLRIHESLPGETEDLLARWVAAATLASDLEGHGLARPESAPWSFDEVVIEDPVSLDVIARAGGLRVEDVEALNPQILRGYLQGGRPRTIRLPEGTRTRFEEGYAQIPPSERLSLREHVVEAGETLSHIAQRHGVPLSELLEANEGIDPRRLRVGARVRIP